MLMALTLCRSAVRRIALVRRPELDLARAETTRRKSWQGRTTRRSATSAPHCFSTVSKATGCAQEVLVVTRGTPVSRISSCTARPSIPTNLVVLDSALTAFPCTCKRTWIRSTATAAPKGYAQQEGATVEIRSRIWWIATCTSRTGSDCGPYATTATACTTPLRGNVLVRAPATLSSDMMPGTPLTPRCL